MGKGAQRVCQGRIGSDVILSWVKKKKENSVGILNGLEAFDPYLFVQEFFHNSQPHSSEPGPRHRGVITKTSVIVPPGLLSLAMRERLLSG